MAGHVAICIPWQVSYTLGLSGGSTLSKKMFLVVVTYGKSVLEARLQWQEISQNV